VDGGAGRRRRRPCRAAPDQVIAALRGLRAAPLLFGGRAARALAVGDAGRARRRRRRPAAGRAPVARRDQTRAAHRRPGLRPGRGDPLPLSPPCGHPVTRHCCQATCSACAVLSTSLVTPCSHVAHGVTP
jgi:hypothetical protein